MEEKRLDYTDGIIIIIWSFVFWMVIKAVALSLANWQLFIDKLHFTITFFGYWIYEYQTLAAATIALLAVKTHFAIAKFQEAEKDRREKEKDEIAFKFDIAYLTTTLGILYHIAKSGQKAKLIELIKREQNPFNQKSEKHFHRFNVKAQATIIASQQLINFLCNDKFSFGNDMSNIIIFTKRILICYLEFNKAFVSIYGHNQISDETIAEYKKDLTQITTQAEEWNKKFENQHHAASGG